MLSDLFKTLDKTGSVFSSIPQTLKLNKAIN